MRHQHLVRALLVAALFLLSFAAVWSASAQSIPAQSTNFSGSITATNTFQVIQGQTNNRKGCLIQNNGAHTMYVYFGAIANATTGIAFQLAAGGTPISCAVNGTVVLQDAVSITGTAGESFTANFQ